MMEVEVYGKNIRIRYQHSIQQTQMEVWLMEDLEDL